MDARFETDQLRAAIEQQVLAKPIAPVHLERQPAEVAQLLLTQAQERTTLPPELARRGSMPPPPWRSRRDGVVGRGLSPQQSSQERDAHHAPSLLTAPEAYWPALRRSVVRSGRAGRRTPRAAHQEDDEQDEPGCGGHEHDGK